MPLPCTICSHPQRQAFEHDLAAGQTYRTLASSYQVSLGAISRHLDHLVPAQGSGTQTAISEHLAEQHTEQDGILDEDTRPLTQRETPIQLLQRAWRWPPDCQSSYVRGGFRLFNPRTLPGRRSLLYSRRNHAAGQGWDAEASRDRRLSYRQGGRVPMGADVCEANVIKRRLAQALRDYRRQMVADMQAAAWQGQSLDTCVVQARFACACRWKSGQTRFRMPASSAQKAEKHPLRGWLTCGSRIPVTSVKQGHEIRPTHAARRT